MLGRFCCFLRLEISSALQIAHNHRQNSSQLLLIFDRCKGSHEVAARLDGFVSWLWQGLVHVVAYVAPERGELGQCSLPRVEAVEQWKTVLGGGAYWGSCA